MRTISISLLNTDEKKFLAGIGRATGDDPGIPIYLRAGEKFLFIEDFNMETSENKKFEEDAPKRLYRGGGIALVRTKYGILAVPDERYGFMKPLAAGIATFAEGDDLTRTCFRELIEEAFVYSLDHETRFVPPILGLGEIPRTTCLGFDVENLVEAGTINVLNTSINDTNRSFEMVIEWDISKLELPFSVNCEEEWFRGGNSAISVFVLDENGVAVGIFSGQQGFVPFPEFSIHPTLAEHL